MKANIPSKLYYSTETILDILIAVICSSKGIKSIILKFHSLPSSYENATKLQSNDPYLFGIFNQLKEYFAGTRKEFDVPLDIEGTDFQKRVWNELQNIPYGKTISYKSLSEKLGDVKAIRAVGKANGQNPIAIIIPCHRVIGANGTLVGYALNCLIENQTLKLFNICYFANVCKFNKFFVELIRAAIGLHAFNNLYSYAFNFFLAFCFICKTLNFCHLFNPKILRCKYMAL